MGECGVYRGEVGIETRERFEVIDVTGLVEGVVRSSGITEGLVNVFVPHTTAGIIVNEAERGLMEDFLDYIRGLTRPGGGWRHNRIDDNAHAHLGQATFGGSLTIPLGGGRLLLGTWQRLLFVEMDGPRKRRLVVTVVGTRG